MASNKVFIPFDADGRIEIADGMFITRDTQFVQDAVLVSVTNDGIEIEIQHTPQLNQGLRSTKMEDK